MSPEVKSPTPSLPRVSAVVHWPNNVADHDKIIMWDSEQQQWLVHNQPPSPPPEGVRLSPPPYYSIANAQARVVSGSSPQTSREAFASPSGFIGPSLRPGLHPYYSASDSFDCPPPATVPTTPPSPNFFSFIGRTKCPKEVQVSAPLPPLPSSFSRYPPPNVSYDKFHPIYLIGNSKNLDMGFPILPPPSRLQPHPFTSHDVNEADWSRFLGDLQRTAALWGSQQVNEGRHPTSHVAVGFLGGSKVSDGSKPTASGDMFKYVCDLIDIWNEHFFYCRQLEVILARGPVRLDCRPGPVPAFDVDVEEMAPLERSSSSSASSLLFSDCSHPLGQEKMASINTTGGADTASASHVNHKKFKNDDLFRLFVVCKPSNAWV